MTLPASGPISFNNINVELGVAGTTNANINQASYRTLAGVPSGTISLSNFYGKSNRVVYGITASGNNYDVFANRGGSYVAGVTDLTVTVPGTIGSTSTGAYAMLIPSGFSPGDTVTLVNNGVIQGMGGAGGQGSTHAATPLPPGGQPGLGGGNALFVNRPVTIFNNATIAGGGGGGGGGSSGQSGPTKIRVTHSGGGGGGGAGTNGGAGGPRGLDNTLAFPGSPGTSGAGGAGGLTAPGAPAIASPGGAGGGRGAAGTAGVPGGSVAGSAGGAGNYIVGNAFVTWGAFGTLQGGVS